MRVYTYPTERSPRPLSVRGISPRLFSQPLRLRSELKGNGAASPRYGLQTWGTHPLPIESHNSRIF